VSNAEQILRVATELFATLGYEGTSLQAIADRVGVTKQTLLYHYPSKEELRRAVLDQVFGHFRERLPQMLQAVTSGKGRFDALTQELLVFFGTDDNRARLVLREFLDNPDGMRRLLAENMRPWLLLIGQYVREGQALGLIHPDVDPEAYVVNVNLSLLTTIAVRTVGRDLLGTEGGSDEDVHARQMKEMLRIHREALFAKRAVAGIKE
jgi:TetR/AcrR family transcriptional regulator